MGHDAVPATLPAHDPVTVWGLARLGGGQGLILNPGQRFRVDLTNALDVPTIVHWHGQIPSHEQDGEPDLPLPLPDPGESRAFDFGPPPGTRWMHSHVPEQEMCLLAAPLIVRSAEDVAADRQEVVMFVHDFAFKTPEEVLAEITGGAASAHAGHGMAAPADGMDDAAMGHDMSGMGGRRWTSITSIGTHTSPMTAHWPTRGGIGGTGRARPSQDHQRGGGDRVLDRHRRADWPPRVV
ncbi:MAG TPA: multicopper oxidase domain-containing protein [Albidovulum sp.]|uniref:multicopper oxidase domain-containing protein n=1 Tax=Albidovulum sp. TaxID=1872424 RepID=UPI002CF1F36C|nr:multicopper oxidase domain-containing protein [Albidovulum sp.]